MAARLRETSDKLNTARKELLGEWLCELTSGCEVSKAPSVGSGSGVRIWATGLPSQTCLSHGSFFLRSEPLRTGVERCREERDLFAASLALRRPV